MIETPETRIIFFGTSSFALPALSSLLERGYTIAAVVTNPDEPAGRSRQPAPPPVKKYLLRRAKKPDIPIFQPSRLDEYVTLKIAEFKPDIFIVASYGKIIPEKILALPPKGALNLHPSLLPRWRGPSPIQYAILQGDSETGVTIIKMDGEMDHGPIVAIGRISLSAGFGKEAGAEQNPDREKPSYPQLHDRLSHLGAELLIATLPKWLRGEIRPTPQDESKATFSKLLKKEDGRIDWSRPAAEIERKIRAFTPWPGAWTLWVLEEKICRIRIERAEAVPDESLGGSAGYVGSQGIHPLLVTTGSGSLWVKNLTLEGQKSLDAAEFLRGHRNLTGSNLI